MNVGFGQSLDHWMPNARASSAFPAGLTAVHAASCLASWILTHRSCTLRNTSPHMVTFVTFIQNTTVSLILLSSTGVQPNFVIGHHHWLWILMPWRRMLLHVLMKYLCFRSNGKIFVTLLITGVWNWWTILCSQITLHSTFQHTAKDYQVVMPPGLTEDITVTALCLPQWVTRCRPGVEILCSLPVTSVFGLRAEAWTNVLITPMYLQYNLHI